MHAHGAERLHACACEGLLEWFGQGTGGAWSACVRGSHLKAHSKTVSVCELIERFSQAPFRAEKVPTAPDVHEQSRISSLPLTGMTRRTPDCRTISVCSHVRACQPASACRCFAGWLATAALLAWAVAVRQAAVSGYYLAHLERRTL